MMRKHIPLKVQLAAALLQLVDGDGKRLVSHDHAKLMTADQVISLYEKDHHPIRVADGGPSEAWNITWRLRAEHKAKTATIDLPQMAKQRRIRAREQKHLDAMCKIGTEALRAVNNRKTPSRRFPRAQLHFKKQLRKMARSKSL